MTIELQSWSDGAELALFKGLAEYASEAFDAGAEGEADLALRWLRGLNEASCAGRPVLPFEVATTDQLGELLLVLQSLPNDTEPKRGWLEQVHTQREELGL